MTDEVYGGLGVFFAATTKECRYPRGRETRPSTKNTRNQMAV